MGGFVENPNLPGGECFREFIYFHHVLVCMMMCHYLFAALINITLELTTYNTAEGDGFVEVCAVLDSGMIEVGQSITTLLETSPGTASTGKISKS